MLFRAKFQLNRYTLLRLRARHAVKVMKTLNLTEFDLLTLKFYHERELRSWQPIRSTMVASFEQKNAI